MSVAFILRHPWGLLAGPEARTPLRGDAPLVLSGWCGLFLAAPAKTQPRVAGRRLVAQPEGREFPWQPADFRLYALPVALSVAERKLRLELDTSGDVQSFTLVIEGCLAKRRNESTEPLTSSPVCDSNILNDFVLGMLSRIRAGLDDVDAQARAFGREAVGIRLSWGRLAVLWNADPGFKQEPPMHIIVHHAEHLARLVGELAERPRRVLARTREHQHVAGIQELDAACLTWYVRQPGVTTLEKAGSRQELLAIARHENFDTPENRILGDLLHRSVDAAAGYCRTNMAYRRTTRWAQVRRYGALCRRLSQDLLGRGVHRPSPPPRPNYVLLHDPRYKRIWSAYLDLLRHREEEDDAWRWQVRLWADLCRLIIQVALLRTPGIEIVAVSPLLLRGEQARGRWSENAPQCTLFLHQVNGAPTVVSPIDAQTDEAHPRLEPWMYALGCAMVIDVEQPETGRRGSVLVWPVHWLSENGGKLDECLESADYALCNALKQEQTFNARSPRARGLVLMSQRNPQKSLGYGTSGLVRGLCFGPQAGQLGPALLALQQHLPEILVELCRD